MSTDDCEFQLVIRGPGLDTIHPLSQRTTTIGRSSVGSPDVEIDDREAAPRHCVLDWDAGARRHTLRVLGINGLLLNGVFVGGRDTSTPLTPGDEFRIGATVFSYESSLHDRGLRTG